MKSFVFIDQAFAEQKRREMSDYAHGALKLEADKRMALGPYSVTYQKSPASDRHEYYSEGPYWWPDGGDESKPYIRRDGEVNPNRFTAHEKAMFALCDVSVLLAQAGYFLEDRKYSERAALLLNTWFLNPETAMRPNLRHAQAIRNVCDGRFIGLIDSTALMNVVHAAGYLEEMGFADTVTGLRAWFKQYLFWLDTDEESQKERYYGNNHAMWWNAQAAAFAAFTGRDDMLDTCCKAFRERLLPDQMAPDGSFPNELARMRSFMYCNFNLEACALTAQIAMMNGADDLWHFALPDGRSIEKGLEFMLPYYRNPFKWTYPQVCGEWISDTVAPQLASVALDRADFQAANLTRRGRTALYAALSHAGPIALLPGYGTI